MTEYQFQAEKNYIKPLGRTVFQDGTRWCALSGSGIAFTVSGTSLGFTLAGDDATPIDTVRSYCCDGCSVTVTDCPRLPKSEPEPEFARAAVFVDGIPLVTATIAARTTHITLTLPKPSVPHEIRLVKLTEAPMSLFGIRLITTDGTLSAAPDAPFRLEIIGDSITCGYGVEASHAEEPFSTRTENVTKAYSYLTANALSADYSIVSFSGYGILSGYTTTDEPLRDQLVPDYYDLVGYSRGRVNGLAVTCVPWNFSEWKPDCIVINLGTNDDSYCKGIAAREERFVEETVRFLKTIQEKNPSAYLLYAFGVMLDRMYPVIEQAVTRFRQETGYERISTLRLTTHTEADGFGADWHPSPKTQQRTAAELTKRLRELFSLPDASRTEAAPAQSP